MTTDQLFTLLVKRLSGNATESEQRQLDQAPASGLEDELRTAWQRAGQYRAPDQLDTDRAWDRLNARMRADKAVAPTLRVRHRRTVLRYVAAASVALVMALVGYWFVQPTTEWHTGAGEQLALTLPDGSQVRLNQQSSLRLAEDFGETDRSVQLSGEAYFEVKKSAAGQRFRVYGDGSVVTVLGTAFNFRSYPDERMCDVEVTEGRVRLTCEDAQIEEELTAGHRARILGYRELLDLSSQAPNATAWKRGYLQFRDTPLSEALIDLNHFYGFTILAPQADLSACPLNGRFEAADRAGLIEVLRKTFDLEVRATGPDQYTILGAGCRG